MKKLILLVSFFPMVAGAQVAPLRGCYMDRSSFPNCSFLSIDCDFGSSVNYGFPIARVCDDLNDARALSNAAVDKLNATIETLVACDDAYKALSASYDATESNRQEWVAYGQAQAALVEQSAASLTQQAKLIAKLRRRCGKACRRVK